MKASSVTVWAAREKAPISRRICLGSRSPLAGFGHLAEEDGHVGGAGGAVLGGGCAGDDAGFSRLGHDGPGEVGGGRGRGRGGLPTTERAEVPTMKSASAIDAALGEAGEEAGFPGDPYRTAAT